MSIIENGKKIAGNYKIQLAPEASTENAGVIKIATDQDIQDGTSEKLAVTPKQLNSYVSKDDISEVAKTGSYNDLIDVPEQYSLPIASTVELGGVKVDGNTINVDESGIISVGNLDNKANVSLSNLDAIGEAKIGSALNNKITNCLLEVPQRIKYTLENGTLTIHKGSVVIVPYGTEDKTNELPVGATFIHENFKIYDTQYTEDAEGNGKFFVWAELQNDTIQDAGTNAGTSKRVVSMSLTDNTTIYNVKHYSTNSPSYTESVQYYNTATNYVIHTNGSGGDNTRVVSFPIIYIQADGTYVYGNILNVFNGFGYIGSTTWVDKGVKGLIPNGRNEDGTLVNVEYELNNLLLRDVSGNSTSPLYKLIFNLDEERLVTVRSLGTCKNLPSTVNDTYAWVIYNETDNLYYFTNGSTTANWQKYLWSDIANVQVDVNGTVTNLNPKQPFRAVDFNDYATKTNEIENNLDGKWVAKTTVFLNLVTLSNSETTVVSLSSYLPNDGNIYEVMFSMEGSCGTAQFRFDTGYGSVYALYAKSIFGGAFNMVVSPERTLNIYRTSICSGTNKMVLRATAYRKVR